MRATRRECASALRILHLHDHSLHLYVPRLPTLSAPSYGRPCRFHVGACTPILFTTGGTVMVASSLCLHRGARLVEREELDRIDAPPGTDTWFPIRHSHVLDTAILTLQQ